MKKELLEHYNTKKEQIQARLAQFKALPQKDWFKEFQYCLLTPQSNAKRCWEAVEQLSQLSAPQLSQIEEILKTRTRFYRVKAKRIIEAPVRFQLILPSLLNPSLSTVQLRGYLAKEVNGYGLKEASHFLRNIGKSNNQLAILDRHILRHLNQEEIKSPSHYKEIEQQYLRLSGTLGIPADELDLLFWSIENGDVFK